MILIIQGMCMGAADIVPGISGGTMAFIMGIYEKLLLSINSINYANLRLLSHLQFRKFFENVEWKFLLALLTGICFSFLSLANLFHYILNDPIWRIYLYSAFLGLIAASVYFCAKQIPEWKGIHFVLLGIGMMIAWKLTNSSIDLSHLRQNTEASGLNPWLMFCGAIAVTALLLPGISGSYMLTILGVYPSVIGALADFTKHLKLLTIDWEALSLLSNLGIGILIGGVLFSRVVYWLLKHYHGMTIALMTGFMVGAIKSIWPFWSYTQVTSPLKVERGVILQLQEAYIPSSSDPHLWIGIACAVCGCAAVITIERLARKSLVINNPAPINDADYTS